MSRHPSELAHCIKTLYPGAVPFHATVRQDAEGDPYIDFWDEKLLGPKPLEADVLANEAGLAAAEAAVKAAAQSQAAEKIADAATKDPVWLALQKLSARVDELEGRRV